MPAPQVGSIAHFDPDRVRPLPGQPRKRFSGIKELASSILEIGQTVPGQVTIVKGDPKFDAQLIDGERRLRACQFAEVHFRAEVCKDDTPAKIFARSFASNFGKQHHDPIEIAESLKRLVADGMSQRQAAAVAGMSECWVSQHLALLELPSVVRDMMITAEGERPKITLSHAMQMRGLGAPAQIELAKGIARGMTTKGMRKAVDHFRAKKNLPQLTSRSLIRLTGLVETFYESFGRYVELPHTELGTMIDKACRADRDALINQLDLLMSDAGGLLKAIAARSKSSAA